MKLGHFSIFESVLPFQKYLLRDELKTLSRRDFIVGADETAMKRVKAIQGLFGEVPANIFTGELAPKHSRRKLFITEQEQALLNSIAAGAQEIDGEAERTHQESESGAERSDQGLI